MKTLIKLLQLNHFNRTLKHFYTWTTGASVDYSIFKTSLCFYFKQFGHHQNQPSFTKLSLHLHVFRLNFRQQCVRRRQQPPQNNWGETFSFSFWCPFRSARSSDRGASDSVQIQGQLNVCHKKNPRVKTLRFCLRRLPERGQTFQNRLHHLDSYEYESRRGLSVRLIKNETWRTFSK